MERLFAAYFRIFPWDRLPRKAEGFDLGCGSGRWAAFVAPKVGRLHCIDASLAALEVAKRNLSSLPNCRFHEASVEAIPLRDGSMDFGYSIGVLHHVPDTAAALKSCVRKLKPGAPFLVYLYYAFENRPLWFRWLWRASDALRRGISLCPYWLRSALSQTLAALLYYPLARLSLLLERSGLDVSNFPLAFYRRSGFYSMRTDALDRFGTPLEKRFTAAQTRSMMEEAGLTGVVFSEQVPYWCAVGFRR